jgi:two-component system, chemotaxis family, chemotaxis protein CheY
VIGQTVKTIESQAEHRLLSRIEELFYEDPYQRCMFLRFSQIEPLPADWKTPLTETIREFFDGEAGELYLCQDRDIFMINRQTTFKKLDQFIDRLNQFFAPASFSGLASLFEIGIDMDRIKHLCRKKIDQSAAAKPLPEDQLMFPTPRLSATDYVDKTLVASLQERRKNRKHLEILVVEDDPFSQKLIKNAIGKQLSVTLTSDGQGAIMNYLVKAPDILFLDIGLPDMDGHEVLKNIFAIDPEAFVVMFSGKGDRENIMRAVELGAKGFVGKPFTSEKLFQYIEKSPFTADKRKRA